MPVSQDLFCPITFCPLEMLVDQLLYRNDIRFGFEPLKRYQLRIQIERERIVQIEHVGDSSGHAGTEVFPGTSENQ